MSRRPRIFETVCTVDKCDEPFEVRYFYYSDMLRSWTYPPEDPEVVWETGFYETPECGHQQDWDKLEEQVHDHEAAQY